MYLRTSHALVMCPDNGQTIAFNFLKQTSFVCSEPILSVLHHLNDWRPITSLKEVLPELSDDDLQESVEALVEVGGLVVQGSQEDAEEQRKVDAWEWGIPSALLHYGEQNRTYLPQVEAEAMQREKANERSQPPLYKLNTGYEKVHKLHRPLNSNLGSNSVLDLMARRRTVREVKQTEIPLEVLSDCLFAGLGITQKTRNCVGDLPLSMTPSGGARNPYEAYVYAPRVTGLEPGFYHYSAMEHSLGQVSAGLIENPASLIGDQPWINDMSAIVFLCAHFERTMWKYEDNNAYRVVLIEAGHIGQNVMLAATENGLTACPSAALAHDRISQHLQLENALQSPVYALMIGAPRDGSLTPEIH